MFEFEANPETQFGFMHLGVFECDPLFDICILYRWWSAETIAVVTGGNRGIGFEITRQLAAHGLTVILTSRDPEVGCEAAKVLQEGGLNVYFHQLDVLDQVSIKEFCDWLVENYGGLDILVSFRRLGLRI